MTTREKVLAWAGVAVLVAALVAYSQYQNKLDNVFNGQTSPTSRRVSTAPTGNVDNTVNELLEDVAGEISVSADEDSDADLIDDDSQAINSIGDAYVGNEF